MTREGFSEQQGRSIQPPETSSSTCAHPDKCLKMSWRTWQVNARKCPREDRSSNRWKQDV